MKNNKFLLKKSAALQTNVRLLESVQEYLDFTEHLSETFCITDPWYRGVSHTKYSLIPKVCREFLRTHHRNFEWWLFVDFVNRVRPFISDHYHYSQFDWYFTMQHYGLPTRLLDWTRGSLIALYFAVRDPNNTFIPTVYLMDPYWWDEFVNKKDKGEGIVYNTNKEVISKNLNSRLLSYMGEGEKTPAYPICIEPPAINSRIHAQKSVFTIHGTLMNPFKILMRDNERTQIVKIRFSTKKAKYIKHQLFEMGITEGTLFPDIEGLVQDIKYERGIY